MIARDDLSAHSVLIKTMQNRGYKVSSQPGLCAGLSMAALHSFFNTGHLDTFNQRIALILQTYDPELQTIKEPAFLAMSNRQEWIDMLAFFDLMSLYQEPLDHADVINANITQTNPIELLSWAAANNISTQKPIVKSLHWPNIYTANELENLCVDLHESARIGKTNFAITIENASHRILLCYQSTTNTWLLMDSNRLPAISVTDPKRLAAIVHESMRDGDLSAIETTVYAPKSNLKQTDVVINHLSKNTLFTASQMMTYEKSLRKTANGITLGHVAARHGHVSQIKQLQKLQFNFNQCDGSGWTPAHVAAENNHTEILKVLAHANANLDAQTQNESTPLYIACQEGHVDVVDYLTKQKHIDIDYKKSNGWTPAGVAAKQGHLNVLKILANSSVNLTQTINGKTLIELVEASKQDGMKKLLNSQSTKKRSAFSLLGIFKKQNQQLSSDSSNKSALLRH